MSSWVILWLSEVSASTGSWLFPLWDDSRDGAPQNPGPYSPELEPAPHQKTICQGFLTGKALGTVHAKGLQGSSELEPVWLGGG